jgi:hypothetical protein
VLAAVVLTRNEESNIEECLRSLAWADQLLVLDSNSTDGTVEAARKAGARVELRTFVNYADQRNAAFDLTDSNWVFFVDADERASPELASEVRTAVQSPSIVGWWVPRRNYIWGKWIQHAGWYPDYQLRLLKRGSARYDLARPVHEVVNLDGQEGWLQNALIHYNYRTVLQFLRKQDAYATFEARILREKGIHPRPHSLILQPLREFWRRYVSLQGYRDGGHGLVLSLLMGYYTHVAYRRARSLPDG